MGSVFALGRAVVFMGICARLGAIRARVKFTHFGSLATLLWLYLLKSKNCKISIKTYLIFSFKITLPLLFITLFGVYL